MPKLGDWFPQFVDKAQTTCMRQWYHIAPQNKQQGPLVVNHNAEPSKISFGVQKLEDKALLKEPSVKRRREKKIVCGCYVI